MIRLLQFLAASAELFRRLLDLGLMLFDQFDARPAPACMGLAHRAFAFFDQFFQFPLGVQLGSADRRLHRRPAFGQGLQNPRHVRQCLSPSHGTHELPHAQADDGAAREAGSDSPPPAQPVHRGPGQGGRSEQEDQKRPAVLQEPRRRLPDHVLKSRLGRRQRRGEVVVRVRVSCQFRGRDRVFRHGAFPPPQDLLSLPPDLFEFLQPAQAAPPDAVAVLPRLVLVLIELVDGGPLGDLELPFGPLLPSFQLLGRVLVELLRLLDDAVAGGLVLIDGLLAKLAILAAEGDDFLLEFAGQLLAQGLVLVDDLLGPSGVSPIDVLLARGTPGDQFGEFRQGLLLSIQECVLHGDGPPRVSRKRCQEPFAANRPFGPLRSKWFLTPFSRLLTRLSEGLPIPSRPAPALRPAAARRPRPR